MISQLGIVILVWGICISYLGTWNQGDSESVRPRASITTGAHRRGQAIESRTPIRRAGHRVLYSISGVYYGPDHSPEKGVMLLPKTGRTHQNKPVRAL